MKFESLILRFASVLAMILQAHSTNLLYSLHTAPEPFVNTFASYHDRNYEAYTPEVLSTRRFFAHPDRNHEAHATVAYASGRTLSKHHIMDDFLKTMYNGLYYRTALQSVLENLYPNGPVPTVDTITYAKRIVKNVVNFLEGHVLSLYTIKYNTGNYHCEVEFELFETREIAGLLNYFWHGKKNSEQRSVRKVLNYGCSISEPERNPSGIALRHFTPEELEGSAQKPGQNPGIDQRPITAEELEGSAPKPGKNPGIDQRPITAEELEGSAPKPGKNPGIDQRASTVKELEVSASKPGQNPGIGQHPITAEELEGSTPKPGQNPGIGLQPITTKEREGSTPKPGQNPGIGLQTITTKEREGSTPKPGQTTGLFTPKKLEEIALIDSIWKAMGMPTGG